MLGWSIPQSKSYQIGQRLYPYPPFDELRVVSLSFDFAQDSELVELSNHRKGVGVQPPPQQEVPDQRSA